MQGSTKAKLFFEGQLLHFFALAILLGAVYGARGLAGFEAGAFLGVSTGVWALLAIGDAILHQIYVWFCWRTELHGGYLTRWLGSRAFALYSVLFAILIVLRPVLIFTLGWANRGTLEINAWLGYGVSALLAAPAGYLMYSVAHYFSFRRALGIDHFEARSGSAPLVRQGIFRITPNAMYVFGFFALWIPAFLFQSLAALVIAGFSHAYIWVHYYATEKPDMARIYG